MKLGWMFGAALALLSSVAASAELRVVDGDSFTFDGKAIRLWGIDTADSGQQCTRGGRPWYPGRDAAAALGEILARAEGLTCTEREVDRQGRAVSTCRAGGKDIGHAMVQAGWAWDYFEYSRGFYIPPEAEARNAKRGVWAGDCVVPWRYRRLQR
jgi:endonuclease YncB( thermonuclease family)